LSTELERTADNTILYSYDEAKALLANSKCSENKMFLIRDLILYLLNSHPNKPIYGRTMLVKQIFLLFEEVIPEYQIYCQNANFVPYDFGPYSFTVMQIVEDLRFSKLILVDGRKNSRKEAFHITQSGIEQISKMSNQLNSEFLKAIKQKRIGWDQLGTDGILRYVYEKYPDMKVNSKLKSKYKDITWGQGKA
jgi:uncharacterized protein YwgA